MAQHKRMFQVNVPRHSIGRAEAIARAAGWATQVHRVRSAASDAPDILECSLPPRCCTDHVEVYIDSQDGNG